MGDPTRRILLGLIGAGIQDSRTPFMQEREAAAQGLHCLYQLLDLDRPDLAGMDLDTLLSAVQRAGFAGVNITHPCKQTVLAHLDEVSDDARALGAVNTVALRHGRRQGHNTDWLAFHDSLRDGLPGAALDRVALLGAGGAGSAAAYALLRAGAGEVVIYDADSRRAESLLARLNDPRLRIAANPFEALHDADGLVHATPTGMASHPGLPLDERLLHDGLWVVDVVYFPLETALLGVARERGCRTLDGSGMAIGQAAASFELFTGLRASRERMRGYFSSFGNGRS